ncbi:MAG: hypothetical protein WAR78_14080 [Ferruginibacter sp.]
MKKIYTFFFLLLNIQVFSQLTPTEMVKPIVDEGKRLYRSEMASWYGTDVFLEVYKDQSNIGGYFSYEDAGNYKCIFFSKKTEPAVIGTISFDSTYNVKTAKADLTERSFTTLENEYYQIRQKAFQIINEDTLFKHYKNTSLNIIPMISEGKKKVYALTGPKVSDVVVFGNDYLLTFNNDLELLEKKTLHRNIIPINYGKENESAQNEGKTTFGTMHSHLPETGDFITATDICTLMLYAKFTGWKQHNVVSAKYLNVWDCLSGHLTVIPLESINKNEKDQKRKKNN